MTGGAEVPCLVLYGRAHELLPWRRLVPEPLTSSAMKAHLLDAQECTRYGGRGFQLCVFSIPAATRTDFRGGDLNLLSDREIAARKLPTVAILQIVTQCPAHLRLDGSCATIA